MKVYVLMTGNYPVSIFDNRVDAERDMRRMGTGRVVVLTMGRPA